MMSVLLPASSLVKSTGVDGGPSPTEVLADILTDIVWYGLNGDIVYMFSVLVVLKFNPSM